MGGDLMTDNINLYPHQKEALTATKRFNRVAYYLD